MFGTNSIGTGFTLTKMLGGISKVLGIANQAIPLYKEIKPMVGNARKIMSVLKEFKATDTKTDKKKVTIQVTPKKEVENNYPTSKPVFFQ